LAQNERNGDRRCPFSLLSVLLVRDLQRLYHSASLFNTVISLGNGHL
jgi:hypothetical protein